MTCEISASCFVNQKCFTAENDAWHSHQTNQNCGVSCHDGLVYRLAVRFLYARMPTVEIEIKEINYSSLYMK